MRSTVKCVMGTVILLLFGFQLTGCAFGTRKAMLKYPPQTEPYGVAEAQAAPAPAPKKGEIVVVTFNDLRQDKRLIGTVRNGFGMHTADVIATNSVPAWVNDAVKNELVHAGYRVTTNPTEAQSPVTLSGDIVKVYCDAYFAYNGEVSLNVKVNKNGKDVVNKSFVGRGSAGTNWGATADAYSQSLSLALSDALSQMVAELNTSLSAE